MCFSGLLHVCKPTHVISNWLCKEYRRFFLHLKFRVRFVCGQFAGAWFAFVCNSRSLIIFWPPNWRWACRFAELVRSFADAHFIGVNSGGFELILHGLIWPFCQKCFRPRNVHARSSILKTHHWGHSVAGSALAPPPGNRLHYRWITVIANMQMAANID